MKYILILIECGFFFNIINPSIRKFQEYYTLGVIVEDLSRISRIINYSRK